MRQPALTETAQTLAAMAAPASRALPPWEIEWALFGPIPNPGTTANWPGQFGFSPLPLDGALTIPAEATVEGRSYRPRPAISRGGELDFHRLFDYREGCPIVYMMTEIASDRLAELPISFGANWGTQWWLNGELVFETRAGNCGDPDVWSSNQFCAPLRKGRNLLVVKVISGGPGWTIRMAALPPRRPSARTSGGARDLRKWRFPSHARPTRDLAAAALRIEERPGPVPAALAKRLEHTLADHGVSLHWIGIVHHCGSPYGRSAYFPSLPQAGLDKALPRGFGGVSPGLRPQAKERIWTALLQHQVRAIHANGMVATSWIAGTHCRSAALAHPEWKVAALLETAPPVGESQWNLCIHSPYGEALIGFLAESLRRYDLDGFWIDGSVWSHRGKIGCSCEHCRRAFRAAEGLDFPAQADWHDPAFRRWVAWRYQTFMAFWGRLAGRLRREKPHARVVVNHLHRLGGSWHSAIPLDRYDADIIPGTEAADSPFESAFHARLVRAYGKPAAEVWMGLRRMFERTPRWPAESDPLHRYRHHTLCCLTAGVMPSFGTPDPGEKLTHAYDALAGLVHPRRDLIGGVAEPYVAIHLSQQAETFYFSRRPDWGEPRDHWLSVFGWHNLLMEQQFPLELLFDSHLVGSRLAAVPVVVAPLSVALSDEQVRTLEEYVAQGGVLVVGPWFGALDEWGESAHPSRVRPLLGRPAQPPPAPEASLRHDLPGYAVRRLGNGQVVRLDGNIGLRFHQEPATRLADEIGRLLGRLAPPRLTVDGPRRVHVGLYRQPGRLLLHVQNFIAYSESESFPNPVLCAPPPARQVRVALRGMAVRRARCVLARGAPELRLQRKGGTVRFVVPQVEWGQVVELEV